MTRRAVPLLALALALAAASPFHGAQDAAPAPPAGPAAAAADDASLAARIDRYARPVADDGHLSGTLLVARHGRVLYERSWGMADYELAAPNTVATRYNVASVTKPMTQIMALRLIERGAVAPEDPVSKWIEGFPHGDEITVEMLLRHRSGLPHRVTGDADETRPRTAAEVVERAKAAELLFAPGTETSYSSAGYSVVARILELAAGRLYGDLLEQLVLAPAGAVHTSHPTSREVLPGRAEGHFVGERGVLNAPLRDLSFLVGAGSVFSTPRDLFLIQRTLLDGGYGEGTRSELVRESGTRWNGYTGGYRAFADYDAATGLSVVFAGNVFSGAADLLRANVPRLAAGEAVEPPGLPAIDPVVPSEAVRRRVEGEYRLGSSVVELAWETPGRAVLGDWVLVPLSDTTFYSPQDYATVAVEAGEGGEVEALQWGEGPRFPRVGDAAAP
ncbi:MAG TPA: serine hydrolase domain-containing protein [Thermoanaerobaculia bacterium]|nr:serine hydrolase domain-containing protein [Thermoanaerobaculia bacterium]